MISTEQILIRIGNADLPNDIVKNQMITLHSKFQLCEIIIEGKCSCYTISTIVYMIFKFNFAYHPQIFQNIKILF